MAVKVINRNDFPIRDMFDGTPYVFEPNKPTSIPIDAANHLFGWFPTWTDENGVDHSVDPEAMKRHVMKRFGWNTPAMLLDGRADIFYRALSIHPIMYRMVPVEADASIVAEPPKGRPPGRAESRA